MEGTLFLTRRSVASHRREHHRGRCHQPVAQSIDWRRAVAQRQTLHLDQYPEIHQRLSTVAIGPARSGRSSHCLSSSVSVEELSNFLYESEKLEGIEMKELANLRVGLFGIGL